MSSLQPRYWEIDAFSSDEDFDWRQPRMKRTKYEDFFNYDSEVEMVDKCLMKRASTGSLILEPGQPQPGTSRDFPSQDGPGENLSDSEVSSHDFSRFEGPSESQATAQDQEGIRNDKKIH